MLDSRLWTRDSGPGTRNAGLSSFHVSQKHSRPRLNLDLLPCLQFPAGVIVRHVIGAFARIEDHRPALSPFRLGHYEVERLLVAVEHHVEAVVHDALSALVDRRDRLPVQEYAKRFRESRLPILVRHLGAGGREPADVGDLAAADGKSLEPAAATEDGMFGAQANEIASKPEQRRVRMFPVVPGDLVVLAIRVVVAALRAADLVASAEHRHPLRQEQCREEIAHLPAAECEHVRIIRLSLGAAVPRSVVALAVAVLFPVRLVVLVVVRDEIAQRETVVRGNEVDAGMWPPGAFLIEIRTAGEP